MIPLIGSAGGLLVLHLGHGKIFCTAFSEKAMTDTLYGRKAAARVIQRPWTKKPQGVQACGCKYRIACRTIHRASSPVHPESYTNLERER